MYKWAGTRVYEPLQSLNGHSYSIHSVNVSNPAGFGGGKTEALGVKTTADPRGTARTPLGSPWKAQSSLVRQTKSSDSHPPPPPSTELPTEEICRREENLEDHNYIGRTTVKALRVHTTRYGRDKQARHCEPKTQVQSPSNFLHVRISSDQCGTKIKFD